MGRQKQVIRTCALTRTEKPAHRLIRFAVSPDNVLAPDIDARAPGRGVWITATMDAVDQAERKRVFARSLKMAIEVPSDLALLTRTRLEQRLAGALGLARKAGQLVTGATKVAALVGKGEAAALVTAADAAPDGRRKMIQALRRSGRDGEVPHIEVLTAAQLGLALGLENVIHAALADGAAAHSAMDRALKLQRYLATDEREDDTI